jgi:inhibitor of KinA sporulation pathway (predicted exonuclease)
VKVEDIRYVLKAAEKWGMSGKGEQWKGLNRPKQSIFTT